MKESLKETIIRISAYIAILTIAMVGMHSCIEDGFTTSQADQPTFSTDTLDMGTTFTLTPTPTQRFTVYNPHGKMINISSIALREGSDGLFRLNVDGISGREFSNIEIRPNDSIYVFVEATLPENGIDAPLGIERHLDFVTNGAKRTVVLSLTGQDVERCTNRTISTDTRFTADKPYLIFDTLRVAPGATLTIEPGARLYYHTDAALKVEGTLDARGTAERPIEMTGDRTGYVAAEIPYELMSGQWGGIYFGSTSRDNRMAYCSIRNSADGITLSAIDSGSDPALEMVNCQVRNTTNYVVDTSHANLRLIGCELSEASNGIVRLNGGSHVINHCTLANYYLFTALGGPTLQLSHIDAESDDGSGRRYTSALVTNTIIYGLGTDLSHGDLTGTAVTLNRCVLKSAGTDDDNFINCLWDTDPLYYTVRNEYLFDYRLQPESAAKGASDPTLDIYGLTSDRYGAPLASPADLGAYAIVAPSVKK